MQKKKIADPSRVRTNPLRGQNFLVDQTIIERILAISPPTAADHVLEIGPGLGALTKPLSERAGQVTAVEIEPSYVTYLKAAFIHTPQVQIVPADALLFDFAAFNQGAPYRIFANVPYSVTTPLLQRLLLDGGAWRDMTLLLQKEAAERIAYGNGSSNGPLTLLAAYMAKRTVCFDVPAHCFSPAPRVTSAVLYLERWDTPPVAGDIKAILQLAEAGFLNRRKLLANSLAGRLGQGREFWLCGIEACGFSPQCRAEELTLVDFAALNAWYQENK